MLDRDARMLRCSTAALLMLVANLASAAEICTQTPAQQYSAADYATRIAAVACHEHRLWYRPFIDGNGRLASMRVAEAESSRLDDGATETWQRVAAYWRDSGLLWRMRGFPGADDCAVAPVNRTQASSCRAFLIDQPWSAAFVSYVMQKAGVPAFRLSQSHVDYVRDAYLQAATSPYLLLDPAAAKPATGDLLCYVRATSVFGHAGLKAFFDRDARSALNMHCDIVVAGDAGHAYLIGGNVVQGVTMRVLSLNRNGLLWGLPQRTGGDAPCAPDNAAGCNFNRQDWAALLKLKPLPSPAAGAPSPGMPPTDAAVTACCTVCVVGAVPAVPRCPHPAEPEAR